MRSALTAASAFVALSVAVASGLFASLDQAVYGAVPSPGLVGQVARLGGFTVSALILGVVVWRAPAGSGRLLFGLFAGLLLVELACKFALPQPAGTLWTPEHAGVEFRHSYPSGHALRSSYLAGVLIWLGGRPCWPILALPVLTTWEMLAEDSHYLTDVAGGWLLAAAAVLVLYSQRPSDSALSAQSPHRPS